LHESGAALVGEARGRDLATWSVWQGLPVAVDNLGLLAVRYVKQRSDE
jgi:hypothetical protein